MTLDSINDISTLILNVIPSQQGSNSSFYVVHIIYVFKVYKNMRFYNNFLDDMMVNENPTPTMHLEYSLLLRHTFQKLYIMLINWDYL